MRAEFKLRYKGFKSSGSLFFEDTYLHTTPVCQNSTRHMIVSFRSPGIGMFIESSCYTALYSQVPLSFKTHCKSLLSLEWQIVPCLQHSSWLAMLFECQNAKALGSFYVLQLSQQLWVNSETQLQQSILLLNCDRESYHYSQQNDSHTIQIQISCTTNQLMHCLCSYTLGIIALGEWP